MTDIASEVGVSAYMFPNTSIVLHQLRRRRGSPFYALTKKLVLEGAEAVPISEKHGNKGVKIPEIVQAYAVQRLHRNRVLKLLTKLRNMGLSNLPTQKKQTRETLTYELNCRPSGFFVTPKTLMCRESTCPWCFVRRVYKFLFLPLFNHCIKIRNLDQQPIKLFYWNRIVPFEAAVENPPFFRASYGPHQWLQSELTVQFMFPVVLNDVLFMQHNVIQVVPRSMDCMAELEKHKLFKQSRNFKKAEAKQLSYNKKELTKKLIMILYYCLGDSFYKILLPQNEQHFLAVRENFYRRRFVRILPIKRKKGIYRGSK